MLLLLVYGCGAEAPRDSAGTACPDGMALVPADPAYCIDAYEVVVEDGAARSVAGEVPSDGVSFVEAREVCAATPAWPDGAEGRHLVTHAEWRDAGDGTIGEGGTTWPWGDTWDASRCAVPADDGTLTVDATQPAGSYPGCVSPFGVYDQIGNLWDWVDPEMDVDIAAFLARRAAEGTTVTLAEDAITLPGVLPPDWFLGMAGLPSPTLATDPDGRVWVSLSGSTGFPPDGMHGQVMVGEREAGDFLPVTLRVEGDVGWVVAEPARDGEPVTGKVGGAWYVGGRATLVDITYEHIPDYHSSIGFRCVTEAR